MNALFWVLAVLVSFAAAYWVYRADRKRAVPYPWLTAGLRGLLMLLCFALLLAPSITTTRNETRKPVVLLLQDNSLSVAHALGADTTAYRARARELVQRLGSRYRVVSWGFGADVQTDSIFNFSQQATDIATALNRAQEYYGQQNLGAVILASDGRFNQGLNPLFQNLPLQASLYTVALGDSSARQDVRIPRVYGNRTVALNSQFELRADVIAELSQGYSQNVILEEGGRVIASSPLSISTDRFDRSLSFTIKATRPGLHHYVISAPPAPGESNTANNRRDIFVEVVEEKKKILLLAAAPHPDVNAIREALSGMENLQLDIRTADQLPASVADYQLVILHNLPSRTAPVAIPGLEQKALWLILGPQSDAARINSLQDLARLNLNPGLRVDALPAYESGFNAFSLPAGIQAVLDKLPPLHINAGLIEPRPDASLLIRQKNTERATPLLLMQQGARPTALLAGEGLWRWRLFEYRHFNRHEVVDELIRQTVSFLAVRKNERPFRLELPKYVWSDQEPILLHAYLLNANNEQINTPDASLILTDSAGQKQNYTLERSGSAYRLNLGSRAGGAYSLQAQTNYNGKSLSATASFVVEHTPLELMESGADYRLLYGLASQYHGALVPAARMASLYDSLTANDNIRTVIESHTETAPLVDWKWFFFLLLVVAVAEWLLRKYWMAQ